MDSQIPLLRGNRRLLRRMRIGMGHRTQLGENQRQRGNERDAKFEAMCTSWQGALPGNRQPNAITVFANAELLHTNRRIEKLSAVLKRPVIAPKLRWGRQIVPKLEPQLPDLRAGSQRFRGIQQK